MMISYVLQLMDNLYGCRLNMSANEKSFHAKNIWQVLQSLLMDANGFKLFHMSAQTSRLYGFT